MNMGMTLGGLIEALERCDPDSYVMFDFGGCFPTTLASYRGYYDHLALGFSGADYNSSDDYITVPDLLDELKAAIGKTFTGWKGGDYRMDEDSYLWVANPGNTSQTIIKKVQTLDWGMVVLHTRYEDG